MLPSRRFASFSVAALVGALGWFPPTIRAGSADAVAFNNTHAQAAAGQPAGLTMELKLPKTVFFQGEPIPATLVFRNDSPRPFFTWIGTYDRSGRIRDLGFRAIGQDGQTVPDPLRHYFDYYHGLGGGLGNESDLGQWEITLPVNQWLHFERPGVYRLYGWSRRVKPGHKEDVRSTVGAAAETVDLVSPVVTVQIDPRMPAQEHEVLNKAREDLLSDDGQVRHEAVERLRYLQTPAALEMLLPLVGRPDAGEAMLALAGAPDPPSEADRLFQAVADGRLPLNTNMLVFYPWLKTASEPTGQGLPAGISEPFAPRNDAMNALLDAARATLQRGSWNAVSAATLLALFRHDPNDPQTRRLLIAHQADLPDKVADELLEKLVEGFPPEAFDKVDKREFLPLARRMVGPPQCSAPALKLLAWFAPDEARKVVVDDLEHPPFRHRQHFGDPHWGRNPQVDLEELMSLPDDMRLPELDGTLRQRLDHPTDQNSEADEGIESTMLLTARYGSPALLPDMLRVYLAREGEWFCSIERAALRFWLRCDPSAGVQGLSRALQYRKNTGCYHTLLGDVLQKDWHDEALPVTLAALDDASDEVWLSAAEVLASHAATPGSAAKMIATAERTAALPLPTLASERDTAVYRQNALVRLLLKDENWRLTSEQWTRLQALPNNAVDVRRQLDQRLVGSVE